MHAINSNRLLTARLTGLPPIKTINKQKKEKKLPRYLGRGKEGDRHAWQGSAFRAYACLSLAKKYGFLSSCLQLIV